MVNHFKSHSDSGGPNAAARPRQVRRITDERAGQHVNALDALNEGPTNAATGAPCLHAAWVPDKHQGGGPEVERGDASVEVDVRAELCVRV